MSLRATRKRWLILLACVLLPVSFWVCCNYPVREHFEADGWTLEFTHALLRCQVCTASLKRLECMGRPVPTPSLRKSPLENMGFSLYTPVGQLDCRLGDSAYRPFHWPARAPFESDESVTSEDLARGYYDAASISTTQPGAWCPRKKGTPAHWCLGVGGSAQRWLDPMMIDKLEW